MLVRKCRRCGKILTDGNYMYRRVCVDNIPAVECYCMDCAACMVDEHTTNGLLWGRLRAE